MRTESEREIIFNKMNGADMNGGAGQEAVEESFCLRACTTVREYRDLPVVHNNEQAQEFQ
jgi:hypothetical protein